MTTIFNDMITTTNKNMVIKNLLKSTIVTATLYSIMNVAQASGLLVQVGEYHHELPKAVNEICNKNHNCPEIKVSYIASNKDWVSNAINQNINEIIAGKSVYPTVTFTDYEIKIPSSVKQNLDSFANGQIEDMQGNDGMSYSKSVQPGYLGHTGSLELFEISGYDFVGGAHGSSFVAYSILDNYVKKEVYLDDMLLTGKKPALSKLVEAEFDKWLVRNGSSPSDHKASWKFSITDNVTFKAEGLSFLYQQYEIASYAAGMPELTVPYDKLEGIIKSKYIQDGAQLLR